MNHRLAGDDNLSGASAVVLGDWHNHPTMGRWGQRDFGGYIDGASLYEYVASAPIVATDPYGLELIEQKGQYHTDVYEQLPTPKGPKNFLAPGDKKLLYRYPNKCTVLVVLAHQGALDPWPYRSNPNCPLSAVGILSCMGDVKNREYDGNRDVGPISGRIEGWPRMTAPIGTGQHDPLYDLYLLKFKKDARDAFGLTNAANAYNGGNGAGKAAFAKLLEDAWAAAVKQGEQFAKQVDKCDCKEITVVFQGWKDAHLADAAVPGMSRRVKKIPVERSTTRPATP